MCARAGARLELTPKAKMGLLKNVCGALVADAQTPRLAPQLAPTSLVVIRHAARDVRGGLDSASRDRVLCHLHTLPTQQPQKTQRNEPGQIYSLISSGPSGTSMTTRPSSTTTG